MKALLSSLNTAQPIDARLEQIIEAAIGRLQNGQAVHLDQLAAAHPEYADQLRELLPMVHSLVRIGDAPANTAADAAGNGRPVALPHQQLGDFRLVRELGRGGMGTVFEAEQLSMGRRVALKVLPFAALVQDKSLQRFRNEVRAAAALDHPHIVSVYSVGEERGVHYYAMQLIRGQSLADMIDELRTGLPLPPGEANRILPLPKGEGVSTDEAPTIDSAAAAPPSTQRDEQARISTAVDSRHSAEFFRSAARLGIQAAEALQHAHDQGVLHRDVKPSNLMLDAEAQLYITDFGLARIEADAGMTMTGDIVGTLRYMAPEQALAKRVVIDHRADVYSLGATLYELLTLQPAFGETDRSELLKQIAFEEPRPLRKLDRRIPAELETIVLKAMAKNPDERYQTAQRLADDLRAFLDNRPIEAKPPTPWDRAAKWSRRHQVAVLASVVVLAVTTLGLVVSSLLIARERNAAIVARNKATAHLELARNSLRRFQEHRDLLAEAVRLAGRGFNVEASKYATEGCQHLRDLLKEVTGSEIGITSEMLSALQSDCQMLYDAGFTKETAEFVREMIRLRSVYIERSSDPVYDLTRQAFTLSTWPQAEIRDGEEARRLMERALALSEIPQANPTETELWWIWGTTAFAHLRCGDWQKAIETMEKSIPLGDEVGRPASGMDWLLFAMANWHLGNKQQARSWYTEAVTLMNDEDYIRSTPGTDRASFYERHFRSEVAVLLGDPAVESGDAQP